METAVVLGLPHHAAPGLARSYGGAALVETTDPVDRAAAGRLDPPGSAAEEAAAAAPGRRALRALDRAFADGLAEAQVAGRALGVLVAGRDEQARGRVAAPVTGGDASRQRRARQVVAGHLRMAVSQVAGPPFAAAPTAIG